MYSKITEYFLTKTKLLQPVFEITKSNQPFYMFNTGGVEIEVADFLYSIVKCWKPNLIVETGTHLGISSAYMAQALKENQYGQIITYEVISSLQKQAVQLWKEIEVQEHIQSLLQSSLKADIKTDIDILFLDSEPQYRFDEFIYFWNKVKPGGLIIIHDLHPSLGHHGNTYHGVYDWPYGDWKPKLGEFVQDHKVQMIHVLNPRGTVVMQKTRSTDANIEYIRSGT